MESNSEESEEAIVIEKIKTTVEQMLQDHLEGFTTLLLMEGYAIKQCYVRLKKLPLIEKINQDHLEDFTTLMSMEDHTIKPCYVKLKRLCKLNQTLKDTEEIKKKYKKKCNNCLEHLTRKSVVINIKKNKGTYSCSTNFKYYNCLLYTSDAADE